MMDVMRILMCVMLVACGGGSPNPTDPDAGSRDGGFDVSFDVALPDVGPMLRECPGDAIVTDRAGLDALYGCTRIEGELRITGVATPSLDVLAHLEEVTGAFTLQRNGGLTQVRGLRSLRAIGGSVVIEDQPELIALTGLDALTTIGGDLRLQNDDALEDLSGLGALTAIGGELTIGRHRVLASLEGLSLPAELGAIRIEENAALTSLDALEAVTDVRGDVHVVGQLALLDVDGLSALASVGGELRIARDPALVRATLPAARSVMGGLTFDRLPALTTIDMSLETMRGALLINGADALAVFSLGTLDALEGLTITGAAALPGLAGMTLPASLSLVILEDCTSLAHLDALATVREVTGTLRLRNAPALTSATGVAGIARVGEELWLQRVPFEDFTAFAALAGELRVLHLEDLATFDGFDGLGAVTDISELVVEQVPMLADFTGFPAMVTRLDRLRLGFDFGLTRLAGLEALVFVGDLAIEANPDLEDLGALGNVTEVAQDLLVSSDDSLSSLGLSSLTRIGRNLIVQDNATLPMCEVDGLAGRVFLGGEVRASGNAGTGGC